METQEDFTAEIQRIIKEESNLRHVPHKFRTREVCLALVMKNKQNLDVVPDNLKTFRFCYTVFNRHGFCFHEGMPILFFFQIASIIIYFIAFLGILAESMRMKLETADLDSYLSYEFYVIFRDSIKTAFQLGFVAVFGVWFYIILVGGHWLPTA